jgi:hypothetical protein
MHTTRAIDLTADEPMQKAMSTAAPKIGITPKHGLIPEAAQGVPDYINFRTEGKVHYFKYSSQRPPVGANVRKISSQVRPNRPSDWRAHRTSDGQIYYSNIHTRATSWEIPRQKKRKSSPSSFQSETAQLIADTAQQCLEPHSSWQSHCTPDGKTYYYNTNTMQTSWEMPAQKKKRNAFITPPTTHRQLPAAAPFIRPQHTVAQPAADRKVYVERRLHMVETEEDHYYPRPEMCAMFQDIFFGAYCNLSEIRAAVGLPPQTPWLRGGRGAPQPSDERLWEAGQAVPAPASYIPSKLNDKLLPGIGWLMLQAGSKGETGAFPQTVTASASEPPGPHTPAPNGHLVASQWYPQPIPSKQHRWQEERRQQQQMRCQWTTSAPGSGSVPKTIV